jgi:hypothetical protein
MNKSDFSADKQLLRKLRDRLLTISMHYKAPKNHRMSQELVEKDGPSLPFLYQGWLPTTGGQGAGRADGRSTECHHDVSIDFRRRDGWRREEIMAEVSNALMMAPA